MIVPFDQSKHSVAELIPIEGDTVIIIDVPSSFRVVDMFTVKRMGSDDGNHWKELDHVMMTRKQYGGHIYEWEQSISSTHRNSRDTRDYIELMNLGWFIADYDNDELKAIFHANNWEV